MREGFFTYTVPLLFWFLTQICHISQCQTPVIFGVARILVSLPIVTRAERTHTETKICLIVRFEDFLGGFFYCLSPLSEKCLRREIQMYIESTSRKEANMLKF